MLGKEGKDATPTALSLSPRPSSTMPRHLAVLCAAVVAALLAPRGTLAASCPIAAGALAAALPPAQVLRDSCRRAGRLAPRVACCGRAAAAAAAVAPLRWRASPRALSLGLPLTAADVFEAPLTRAPLPVSLPGSLLGGPGCNRRAVYEPGTSRARRAAARRGASALSAARCWGRRPAPARRPCRPGTRPKALPRCRPAAWPFCPSLQQPGWGSPTWLDSRAARGAPSRRASRPSRRPRRRRRRRCRRPHPLLPPPPSGRRCPPARRRPRRRRIRLRSRQRLSSCASPSPCCSPPPPPPSAAAAAARPVPTPPPSPPPPPAAPPRWPSPACASPRARRRPGGAARPAPATPPRRGRFCATPRCASPEVS